MLTAISRSLVWRLVIPIALVICAAVSLHLVLLSSRKDLFDRKLEESARIGRIVQAMMLYDMKRNSLHDFQTYLNMLPFGPDISTIRLYDDAGILKFSVGDSAIGMKVDQNTDTACSGCHLGGSKSVQRENVRRGVGGEYFFQTDFPLENKKPCQRCHQSSGKYLGNLLTELTFTDAEMRILKGRKNMIFTGSLMMFLAVAIIWWLLDNQVIKPIRALMAVIERSKAGDLSGRVPTVRKDEIGYLTNSFNEMMEIISGLRNNLESEVESRTRELESSRIQLLRQENLASLGRLAAGVAHELGNPLTGISSIVQLVKHRKKKDPFVVEQLELVQGEIERLSRLSRQMVDLARPDIPTPSTFDIRATVVKAYQIARLDRKLKKRHIELPQAGAPLLVQANEDAVVQIVINLLFNAADFTPENGKIRVSLREGSDNTVELRVQDNGPGIPEEFQHHIFDPFFSRKQAGTGLGLSVSYNLARSFKGNLILEASDSQGTTFCVKIPSSGE